VILAYYLIQLKNEFNLKKNFYYKNLIKQLKLNGDIDENDDGDEIFQE